MDVAEIRERLVAGQLVRDYDFDAWLPEFVRCHSPRHWTQVGVAARASRWLAKCGVSKVLDVGSGTGKFCVVGALSSELAFVGVEHRSPLVEAARSVAAAYGVSHRVEFVHGDVSELDASSFDALYLYNPFEENLHPASVWIDRTVKIGHKQFARSVSKVERMLRSRPTGSYVITYNSFGGRVPDCYDLEKAKLAGANLLRLWRKTRDVDGGGSWLELEDATVWKPHERRRQLARSRKREREIGVGPESEPPSEARAHLRLVHFAECEEQG